MRNIIYLTVGLLLAGTACGPGEEREGSSEKSWQELPVPEVGEKWVQPVQGVPAQPVWGHADGLQIGISPMPGPRGLMNVYSPYLGHKEGKMINFFAMEPVVPGEEYRGLSELEMSQLDDRRGKRFWSANDSLSTSPQPEDRPARGVISEVDGVETLTVFIFSETFENGAEVYVRLRFFEDRPYEVELTTYATEESAELENFIITATMGNYARLRTLYLEDTTKSSLDLWPDYTDSNFAPHDITEVGEMIRDENGTAYFIAAPNEERPQDAEYADDTNDHWKYYGKKATQYWYKENQEEDLQGLVNGRYAYWGSESPIPGGISFENFELKEPFRNGSKYVFGVSPLSPEEFIQQLKKTDR